MIAMGIFDRHLSTKLVRLGSLADALCPLCMSLIGQKQTLSSPFAKSFLFANKDFPLPISGKSHKETSCFKGLVQRAGHSPKFCIFSRRLGNFSGRDLFAPVSQHSNLVRVPGPPTIRHRGQGAELETDQRRPPYDQRHACARHSGTVVFRVPALPLNQH